MIRKTELISAINKECSLFFTESSFILHPSSVNRFKASGNNCSKAINHYKNRKEEVTVIKWFEDFWVYLEVKFEDVNSFITLSVFQGGPEELNKNQLFRAEWDDYNNIEEYHPQPHWHITSNQAIENTFEEYTNTFSKDDFASVLEEEKSKIIDLNKIHFAMNGNWINNESHVHPLIDNEKIVKWFKGLFVHLRGQLKYVKQ